MKNQKPSKNKIVSQKSSAIEISFGPFKGLARDHAKLRYYTKKSARCQQL